MNELSNALQSRQKTQKEIIKREHLDFTQEAFNENDQSTNEFLKIKAYELVTISSKATLALGRIFTEVFEELGNNRIGTYEKFIKELGYNVRTVQRYRARYELYNKVNNEDSKSLIAILPVKYLEKIMSDEEHYLPFLQVGITKDELVEKIEQNKQLPLVEDKQEEIVISSNLVKDLLLDLSMKAEEKEKELTNKEKLKLKKLLEEIEIIIRK